MLVTIQLPASKDRVTVREIPALIATALHPDIAEGTPRQITRLMKMPTTADNAANWCGAGCRPFQVSMSDEDMAELAAGVWASLPPLSLPVSEPEWQPYAEAMQANPPTGWQLVAWNSGSPHLNAAIERSIAEDEWRETVLKTALRGHLTPRDPKTLLPQPQATGERLLDCFVTVADLTQFLARFDIGVVVEPHTPISQKANVQAAYNDTRDCWKERARQIADEFFDNDTANNCRDSLDGYSKRVMGEMQIRGIHGPRGRIDNHKTIQRDALQGAMWWQGKSK